VRKKTEIAFSELCSMDDEKLKSLTNSISFILSLRMKEKNGKV
jgi:hypothetical protein